MIDVCIQLSDRPYSESCEAYAVLKFKVDKDTEPIMSPVVVAILVPLAMAGGILASLRYSMLPTPCLLYTSPSPRDVSRSRMPSSA